MTARASATQAQRPRRRRMPSMATAIRQAEKAGKAVSGATIHGDGSVSLTFTNAPDAPSSGNPWDEVLKHDAH
jgi:hypothetical protein